MRLTRLTIPLLLFLLMAIACPDVTVAEPHPRPKMDTSVQEVRVIGKDRIGAYATQREFNYKVQKPKQLSWWDRFKMWLFDRIDEIFSNKFVSQGLKWTIWLLAFAILVFAIVRIVGADKVMLFVTGRKPPGPAFTTGEEDIHAMDMDAEIARAESEEAYRRAIRLQYLRSLKLLSEKGRIDWRTSKTNIDYLSELRGSALEGDFRRITRMFEYAWYGENEVGREQYERAATWFNDFNRSLLT